MIKLNEWIESEAGTWNRRRFLSGLLGVGLGMAFWSYRGHAAEGGDRIGHGGFRYRVVPRWGRLDSGEYPVRDCHGMVQDSKGRILLLTNHTDNNVLIYDKGGELLSTWGHAYPGAHGFAIVHEAGEDLLWITDHDRHQVFKTTIDGKVLMKLDYPKESGLYKGPGQFKPTQVAVAPNGDFFVCDGYGLSYIMRYDSRGNLLGTFGGRGDEPYHLDTPHGAMVDTRSSGKPVLIVASRGQEALKRFTLEGEYIDTIPMPGARVCHVVEHKGHLYIPNLNGFVSILDRNNRVVSNPGGSEPVYDRQGRLQPLKKATDTFVHPHGILVDDEGSVYVPQWNSNQSYPVKLRQA